MHLILCIMCYVQFQVVTWGRRTDIHIVPFHLKFCSAEGCYDGSDNLQKDYRGLKATTASGLECQKWTVQSPQEHTRTPGNFPGGGLGDHNYCRNPDNEKRAWCYTMDSKKRWEYCDIPICQKG